MTVTMGVPFDSDMAGACAGRMLEFDGEYRIDEAVGEAFLTPSVVRLVEDQ
jgi:hypothetical protein